MTPFAYLRPATIAEASAMLLEHGEARLLAGGQSLLAAMKLGLSAPTHLVDLQDIADLQAIEVDAQDRLVIGAMVPHARVASAPVVRAFCPMLAELAEGIADPQVREVGTLGGSLANNDPAACWPAGVLALGASLVTNRREIPADGFFQGLFATALEPGELITAVRFPRALWAAYSKQEQPASRFALVGVALARLPAGGLPRMRVAITGLGHGVVRWHAAEQALAHGATTGAALRDLALPPTEAAADLHASAEYRAHLAGVLCRRLAAGIGEAVAPERTATPRRSSDTASSTTSWGERLRGAARRLLSDRNRPQG